MISPLFRVSRGGEAFLNPVISPLFRRVFIQARRGRFPRGVFVEQRRQRVSVAPLERTTIHQGTRDEADHYSHLQLCYGPERGFLFLRVKKQVPVLPTGGESVGGFIQKYTRIDTRQSWNLFWYAPKDQGDSYKECGRFGVCETNNSRMHVYERVWT